MSVILNVLLTLLRLSVTNGRPQSKLPFPHLIDFKESDIGKPVHTFSGVDYSQLPVDVVNRDINICEEEYTKCVRFVAYAQPSCGYNLYWNRLWPYFSICELDLDSCRDMKRRGIPMHGTNYRERGVYYVGEGYRCEFYLRRLHEGMMPGVTLDKPQETTPNLTPIAEYDEYESVGNNF